MEVKELFLEVVELKCELRESCSRAQPLTSMP